LQPVCCVPTVVADISDSVKISVLLVFVRCEGAVVSRVCNAIIIRIIVAGVSLPVLVTVLLARVWDPDTVVLGTRRLCAVEGDIRPAIGVSVRTTEEASPGKPMDTLTVAATRPGLLGQLGHGHD